MKLLRDTHVFLWYISGDPRLPPDVRDAIREPSNRIFLSVASIWEAVIKNGLGKLPFPNPPAFDLPRQRIAHGIETLPFDETVMIYPAALPLLHRDPFDRLLIAQALQHGLTLVSLDLDVRRYALPFLPV